MFFEYTSYVIDSIVFSGEFNFLFAFLFFWFKYLKVTFYIKMSKDPFTICALFFYISFYVKIYGLIF